MQATPRRPAASWPAALLPGALLIALVTTGAATTTSGGSPTGAPADRPITELHVVRGAR
jgi:hypothetical protein